MEEPAHKSRTLPWTAGNLPPDADLSMIGNIMRMGVDEGTAKGCDWKESKSVEQ